MKKITVMEAAKAANGKIINCNNPNEVYISGVSIDSRQDLQGKLFVALKGERTDGHNFVEEAFKKKAVCCLCDKHVGNGPIILVESTYEAIKDLAQYYKSLLNVKVVAITGSVGKTTTKDMIASVLAQKYNVLKTEGNYNNEIGLPLTVFRMEENHDFAVLEMGMNKYNEINNLSKIATPDICVITNIGITHVENFGTHEGILKAKSEIFNYMKKDCKIILNGEDQMLLTLKNKYKNIYYYGDNQENLIYAKNITTKGIENISCQMCINGNINTSFNVSIPFPGKHMVENALAAAAVGIVAGLKTAEIKKGIETFKISKMRMDIFKTNNGTTIINDVYNASPASMEAAIDILTQAKGRKVCILGDMFELGDYTRTKHASIGRYAVAKEIDVIIFVGEYSRFGYVASMEAKVNLNAYYFKTQEDLLKEIKNVINQGDVILVKASRGMGFEKTVSVLKD